MGYIVLTALFCWIIFKMGKFVGEVAEYTPIIEKYEKEQDQIRRVENLMNVNSYCASQDRKNMSEREKGHSLRK